MTDLRKTIFIFALSSGALVSLCILLLLNRPTIDSITSPGRVWITVESASISDEYSEGVHLNSNACLILKGRIGTNINREDVKDCTVVSTEHSFFKDYILLMEEMDFRESSTFYAIGIGLIDITVSQVDNSGKVSSSINARVNLIRMD